MKNKPYHRIHARRMAVTTEEFVIEVSNCMNGLSPLQCDMLFQAITEFMERGSSWPHNLQDAKVHELYDRTIKYLRNPELFNETHQSL